MHNNLVPPSQEHAGQPQFQEFAEDNMVAFLLFFYILLQNKKKRKNTTFGIWTVMGTLAVVICDSHVQTE